MKRLIELLRNNKWTAAAVTVVGGALAALGIVDVEHAESIVAAVIGALLAVLGSEADTKSVQNKSPMS